MDGESNRLTDRLRLVADTARLVDTVSLASASSPSLRNWLAAMDATWEPHDWSEF